MHRTAFNMCGFIQPSFVVAMLDASDPDAFNDRQFFVCPQEVEYKYEELKVPILRSQPKGCLQEDQRSTHEDGAVHI